VTQAGPSVPLWTLCGLLLLFAFKHYVADFMLQTSWIAHGKERVAGWLAPLAVHVLAHGVLTLAIGLTLAPRLWWLALVDVVVHATIDRCKSLLGNWGSWKPTEGQFWWLMGFDQFLHQVTNIALAAAFFIF
jgi:hypothetical protein